MFLSDKYKLKNLDEIIFNKTVINNYTTRLTNSLQNLILYGYNCSGKKTFINILLNNIYGEAYNNVKENEYVINNYGSNIVKIKLSQSKYHLVLNTNNSAIDKYIIQEILVEFCKKNDQHYFKRNVNYKCVIIYKADHLSQQAQFALRRVVEEFSFCRFILVCKNVCSLIEPIRQRFLELQFACPNELEQKILIKNICQKENIKIPEETINAIISKSDRNIKKNLLLLDCYKLNIKYKCNYIIILDSIIGFIINGIKSTKHLQEIRENLGQLFITNLESETIIMYLQKILIKKVKDPYKLLKILEALTNYDIRLKNATRYMLHLEALILTINDYYHCCDTLT